MVWVLKFTFARLCEQQICFLSRRQIRHAISSVEQNRSLALGEVGIRSDLERLVMAETAVENMARVSTPRLLSFTHSFTLHHLI